MLIVETFKNTEIQKNNYSKSYCLEKNSVTFGVFPSEYM